jgi:hypothetical protein
MQYLSFIQNLSLRTVRHNIKYKSLTVFIVQFQIFSLTLLSADRVFESRLEHGCLFLVSQCCVVLCTWRPCDELITRQRSHTVCRNSGRETSKVEEGCTHGRINGFCNIVLITERMIIQGKYLAVSFTPVTWRGTEIHSAERGSYWR